MSKQSLLVVFLFLAIASGFFASYLGNQNPLPGVLTESIEANLDQLIETVDQEAALVLSSLKNGADIPRTPFYFLVLKGNQVVAWNNHQFIPATHVLTDTFKIKLLKGASGEFIARKWKVDTDRFLIAVIPLHLQYKITNDYLNPYWNEEVFGGMEVIIGEPADSQGYPVAFNGSVLFKVLPIIDSRARNSLWNSIAIVSFSIGILLLVTLLGSAVKKLSKTHPASAFLFLLLLVIVGRVVMIFTDFPGRFTGSALFDPQNFASSQLNPSLGDLFLNLVTVFILCFYLFRRYFQFHVFQISFSSKLVGGLISVFSVICVLFGMLFPFVVTQTIYNNSSISLSISQSIYFDGLRIVAFLSIIFAWVSSFLFMHVFLRLLTHQKKVIGQMMLSVIIGSAIFIGINTITGQVYISSFLAGITFIVSVISFTLYNSLKKFSYKTFAYFFIALLCLALNGSFTVHSFEQQRTMQNQLRFASNFLVERDYFGEYLLHDATERIANDVFIQTTMANPLLGKEVIKQKINRISLSGYFNRYTVEVFLYNASGEPLDGENTRTFSNLLSLYDNETFRTEYKGIYCVVNSQGDFSRKYIVLIPILRNQVNVGYVVIELSLKRIIPENVYPELLVDNRFQQGYRAQELSYAIIANRHIQYTAGNYNYDSFVQNNLGDVGLYTKGIVRDKYQHIALEDNNDRVAIVSSPASPNMLKLADFSFQVMLGMMVILLFLLAQGALQYSKSRSLFLAARIQLILNLAFFLPLIAVSIITISLTTKSSQEQLNEDFLRRANRFAGLLSIALHEHTGDSHSFENEFNNLTNLTNLDANVFYPNGRLMATSQPLIFENQLLAPYMNASAYKRMKKGEKVFVSTERVGNLQFNVAYAALFSPDTGEQVGILTIPFFQSAASLERMQITVLANILSIFTLIFIALVAISFLVTKWLTAPLQMITKTIGRISLTRENIPLQWQSNDEIGLLVQEYNQMLVKLNESKKDVERNQRERTWREIAQQVAHEIKNPLTPMKLTLQQLERVTGKDDKLAKVIETLLSQVKSLDDIASSFSLYAKMPEPVMAQVELVALLTRAVNLHAHEGQVEFESTLSVAYVNGDEQLLGRIFSNIILNGIQAVRPGIEARVGVRLSRNGSNYRISISDNGKGIDQELIDKIFLPHFTTKQSGSGLGLAIAKQGIEQMGGKIWFETSPEGTIFTMEFPMHGASSPGITSLSSQS